MKKNSKIKLVNFKETLWKSADKLRNQMDAAEYKHIVLGLIFLKYISDTFDMQKNKIKQMLSDQKSDFFISEDPKVYEKELEDRDYYTKDNVFWVPQKARWSIIRSQAKQPDIGSIIDKSMIEIENENKSLQGKLDKRFGKTGLLEGKLGELIDLISTIGFSNNKTDVDMLGEIYEYFLGRFASAEGKKGGQFYTPRHVVKALVSVLSPYKGRVYDPCCGSGGMFVQSEKFVKSHGGKRDDISIYGQESNPTTWRLAAMNLALRGFAADLGKEPHDTFSNDQHPDKKFDYILINPPFNDSEWGGEKYETDSKWIYGKPPNGNANYAWIQLVIHKLNETGKAGIILGSKSLDSSPSQIEYNIRKKIINNDLVEAIILLPEKLFVNTTTGICIWVLNKNKIRKNETLFINYENRSEPLPGSRKLKRLTDESIYELEEIISSWRDNKDYKDLKGITKSVSLKQIQNENWNLSPKRYVGIKSHNNNISLNLSDYFEQSLNDSINLDKSYNLIKKDVNDNLEKYKSIFVNSNNSYLGWETTNLKKIFTPRNEKVGDRNITEFSCTNFGITQRDNKFTKKLAKSISKNKIARKGDFIFGMSRQILNFGMMKEEIGCFSGAYKIYEVKRGINFSKYLESYIRSNHDYFYQSIPGGAREGKSISEDILFKLSIKIPPQKLLDNYFSFLEHLIKKQKILDDMKYLTNSSIDVFAQKFLQGGIDIK